MSASAFLATLTLNVVLWLQLGRLWYEAPAALLLGALAGAPLAAWVIRHLPRIYGEYRKLKQSVRDRRPDVAVLIDFPDIHLKLAEEFKRLGIPVIFFVSPQLWAWKKGRIRKVQRSVDRMLVIFPFEEPFYRERGVNATYVGHPLADLPLPAISRGKRA